MKRLMSLFAAVAIVVAILPGTAAPAFADSCTSLKVTYYEDQNGTGDYLVKCDKPLGYTGDYFTNLAHTQSGSCATPYIKLSDDWNDCISSFRLTLAADRCIILARDIPWDNDRLTLYGPMSNYLFNITGKWSDGALINDTLSQSKYGHITWSSGGQRYCDPDWY